MSSKRAVLCYRVSSKQQEVGFSLIDQQILSNERANKRGDKIVAELRITETARKVARSGFTPALEMVKRGEADIVYFFEHDRWSRKFADYDWFREQIHRAGAEVYIVKDDRVIPTNAKDRLPDDIKMLFAQADWYDRREKMQARKVRKVQEGKVLAGGMAPYGYSFEGHGKKRELKVNEEEAVVVQQIYRWYVFGNGNGPMGVYEILRRLEGVPTPKTPYEGAKSAETAGKWSKTQVYRILRREAYAGTYQHFVTKRHDVGEEDYRQRLRDKSEWIGVTVEPIIDREIWEMAQQKLARGRELSRKNTKGQYLLGRLLKCQCGYTFRAKRTVMQRGNKEGYVYYYCTGHEKHNNVRYCDMPFIRGEWIEPIVWDWVINRATNAAWVREQMKAAQAGAHEAQATVFEEREYFTNKLAAIEAELDQLAIAFSKKLLPERTLARQSQTLEDERQSYTARLEEIEQQLKPIISDAQIDTVCDTVEVLHHKAQHATFEQQRELLELLDVKGEIRRDLDGHVTVKVTSMLQMDGEVLSLPEVKGRGKHVNSVPIQ